MMALLSKGLIGDQRRERQSFDQRRHVDGVETLPMAVLDILVHEARINRPIPNSALDHFALCLRSPDIALNPARQYCRLGSARSS